LCLLVFLYISLRFCFCGSVFVLSCFYFTIVSHSVPLRDEQGHCIQCKVGEPGLLLSIISSRRPFDGYTDQKATNAKILTDVFKNGDRYFNTGDLLYRDSEGYYYWSDRIGDTFRWKGENVSTTEVSQTLSDCKTIADVVVYGVEVPNTDGKAGMAAVVKKEENLDFDEILAETTKHLPPYAKPLFIRIKNDGKIPTTSTHKYMKTELVKEVSKIPFIFTWLISYFICFFVSLFLCVFVSLCCF
jgi:acyl-CoA synthetase (AMP-forming)/AMP-acid ligase II